MDWSDLTWNQFHGQLTSLGWKPRRYVKISWLRLRLSNSVGTKGQWANCPTDLGRIAKPFPSKGLGLLLTLTRFSGLPKVPAKQQPRAGCKAGGLFQSKLEIEAVYKVFWRLIVYSKSHITLPITQLCLIAVRFLKRNISFIHLMYFCGIHYLSIVEFNLRGCKGQEI